MRLYGSQRKDTIRCRYNCCGGKLALCMKKTRGIEATRRAAKKRARRMLKEDS